MDSKTAGMVAALAGMGTWGYAGRRTWGYTPPPQAGTRGGTRRLRGRTKGVRRLYRGHYNGAAPFQNAAERTRRLWQVHEGQLTGGVWRGRAGGEREWVAYVTDEARHVAHGILPGNTRG